MVKKKGTKNSSRLKVSNRLAISNRLAYTIISVLVIILLAMGVYAMTAGVAPNPGHTLDTVSAPTGCAASEILQWTGTAWDCVAMPTLTGGSTTITDCIVLEPNLNPPTLGSPSMPYQPKSGRVLTYVSSRNDCSNKPCDQFPYDLCTSHPVYSWIIHTISSRTSEQECQDSCRNAGDTGDTCDAGGGSSPYLRIMDNMQVDKILYCGNYAIG